jgi:S-DNA-T family DNA segregation ATPase FtsK/SpoIIIE
MLVGGATGSGKSIFLHGIIMSLIMRNRPEELKLVIVDPKHVEMVKYKDIPHLLCPVINEPSEAKVCFQKLTDEMERRYTLFELSGVSNIRQFNEEYAPQAGLAKLPFIVVVVDEYADLSDSCKGIGDLVLRIAQKARAAGIHLIIATQRPSVQVIPGLIKANLPTRVALSMAKSVDSSTILGEGGAEELVGHGDMLVDCQAISRNGYIRCQGCLVDNREIKEVTDFIKGEMPVVYDPNFLDLTDHEAEAKAQEAYASQQTKDDDRLTSVDDFYEKTVKPAVMAQEYTSISRIQREFGVGFPRAGRLFAQLQQEGIVAAAPETAGSSKGCRVLRHGGDLPANGTSGGTATDGEGMAK